MKCDPVTSHRKLPLVLTGLLGSLALFTQTYRLGDWLVLRDPPTRTDAALVLGGDPYFERTGHAVRLLKKGLVTRLIFCGGEPGPGDHALSLMQHARELGAPEESLLIEDRSHSTRESVEFALPLLQENRIRSLTLVTSPFHQRRTFLAARKSLGNEIRLINSPADPSFWTPEGWWRDWWSAKVVFTEYVKLAYYFVRGWI